MTDEDKIAAYDFLGIKAETLDEFKTGFNGKFVSDEKQAIQKYLSPAIGQKFGKVKQNLLNKARTQGIEFTNAEFDDLDLEQVHDLLVTKGLSKQTTLIEDLKKKGTHTNDEAIKEWETKYNLANTRASDEEKLRKTLGIEFDAFKGESANSMKSIKLDFYKGEIMGKLPFKTGLSELEKAGFDSHVSTNFKLDVDDTGKRIITDMEGQRIRSTKNATEFKDIEEVYTEVADKFGILAKNTNAGKPITKPFTPPADTNTNQNQNQNQNQKRKVSPLFDNY